MPGMPGMPMMPLPATAMTMSLLPWWPRLLWTLALMLVALLHVWHAYAQPGQGRWWHSTHIAMALGMAAMYAADPMDQRALDHTLAVIFGILTLVLLVATVLIRQREHVLNPRWVATAVDTAAMTYMAVLMPSPSDVPAAITWIVVGYLGVETLAWLSGLWDRLPASRSTAIGLSGHDGIDVRISLAVMTASMAYMLAAMIQ